jgi:hypothetical protein
VNATVPKTMRALRNAISLDMDRSDHRAELT